MLTPAKPRRRLTPTELTQLHHMLADHTPRRQISETLHITPRIVDHHARAAGHTNEHRIPHGPNQPYQYPPWMDDALCATTDTDPDLFFPDKGEPNRPAKAVCNNCPVTKPCLTHALTLEAGMSRDHRHGVWGGLTPDQRYELDQGAARLRGPRP